MFLKDAIKEFSFDDIKDRLIELYPDQIENLNLYKQVFELLKTKKVKEIAKYQKMRIYIDYITPEKDKYTDTPYYSVYGKNGEKDPKHFEEEIHWGLEFNLFNHWMNFQIPVETLSKYTLLDIICHCLYEMTFISYDDREIKKQEKKLKKLNKKIETYID